MQIDPVVQSVTLTSTHSPDADRLLVASARAGEDNPALATYPVGPAVVAWQTPEGVQVGLREILLGRISRTGGTSDYRVYLNDANGQKFSDPSLGISDERIVDHYDVIPQVRIYWGDGTMDTVASPMPTAVVHSYPDHESFVITVAGEFAPDLTGVRVGELLDAAASRSVAT